MANATETTKRAAVWNPPRFHKLTSRGIGSGTKPSTQQWEGGNIQRNVHCTNQYRLPGSGEPVDPLYVTGSPHCPM